MGSGVNSGGVESEHSGPGLARKSRIGLVGPMWNYVAAPQLVEDVSYRELDGMRDLCSGVAGGASGDVVRAMEPGAVVRVGSPGWGMSRLQESSG